MFLIHVSKIMHAARTRRIEPEKRALGALPDGAASQKASNNLLTMHCTSSTLSWIWMHNAHACLVRLLVLLSWIDIVV